MEVNERLDLIEQQIAALILAQAPLKVRETLNTPDMAKALHISNKLLLKLRHLENSPFVAGVHYRFQGLTTAAPIRWFPVETDAAFTTFVRVDASDVETMDGEDE